MTTPADELRTAVTALHADRAGRETVLPSGAVLSPHIAEPLADWLAKLADFCDEVERTHGEQPPADNLSIVDALAVARAILGGQS